MSSLTGPALQLAGGLEEKHRMKSRENSAFELTLFQVQVILY